MTKEDINNLVAEYRKTLEYAHTDRASLMITIQEKGNTIDSLCAILRKCANYVGYGLSSEATIRVFEGIPEQTRLKIKQLNDIASSLSADKNKLQLEVISLKQECENLKKENEKLRWELSARASAYTVVDSLVEKIGYLEAKLHKKSVDEADIFVKQNTNLRIALRACARAVGAEVSEKASDDLHCKIAEEVCGAVVEKNLKITSQSHEIYKLNDTVLRLKERLNEDTMSLRMTITSLNDELEKIYLALGKETVCQLLEKLNEG